jgi:hypothetical protein
MVTRRLALVVIILFFAFGTFRLVSAQESALVSPSLFAELRWRSIGPSRASRTRGASGHRSQPFTFYTAAVNGGVWKTTDAGRSTLLPARCTLHGARHAERCTLHLELCDL